MDETAAAEQYKKLPRLYVEAGFGGAIALPEKQAHYLRNVMRLSSGDRVRVFNGRDGEWLAALAGGKKAATLDPLEKIAEQGASPDIWALVSPLRKEPFEFMVEKATELGVSRLVPVLCDHTAVRRMNAERAQAIAIEAAEQSERMDVPQIAPLADLKSVLSGWRGERKLIACLERASAEPVLSALQREGRRPLAVLVGPEGGFSPEEVEFMKSLPFIVPVSLGLRILRAETAVLASLACVLAASHCCDK